MKTKETILIKKWKTAELLAGLFFLFMSILGVGISFTETFPESFYLGIYGGHFLLSIWTFGGLAAYFLATFVTETKEYEVEVKRRMW